MAGQCIHKKFEPSIPVPSLRQEVIEGLCNPEGRKTLPSKYIYDEKGSDLFDRICDLDEYYPTRTEKALLKQHAAEIVEVSKPDNIIEFGSGLSDKVTSLLDVCQQQGTPCKYWPVDVCGEALQQAAQHIVAQYPWLDITSLAGDYCGGFADIVLPRDQSNLALFMGGTIGNFSHAEAVAFIRSIRDLIGPAGKLLIGFDRPKEPRVLEAAYDDKEGVTAQFDINILSVLNQRLGANFDLDSFEYKATYNTDRERVEMYLVCQGEQDVYIKDLDRHIKFADQESILTEISRKFSSESIESLFQASNFSIEQHYLSDDQGFSLVLGKADD